MPTIARSQRSLVAIARDQCRSLSRAAFRSIAPFVYSPLDYAWSAHLQYLESFALGPREVLLVGMNPGPWGMAQTGVPFGEVSAVRDWMGIRAEVQQPRCVHPRVPIAGFNCPRSEVSGRRLWGWAMNRFGTADSFFSRFFVTNYCPLMFLDERGRNLTPDKLPTDAREPLFRACDRALALLIEALDPRFVIGVGGFAEARIHHVAGDSGRLIGRILHPSPASPMANRGWARQAEAQMRRLGIDLP